MARSEWHRVLVPYWAGSYFDGKYKTFGSPVTPGELTSSSVSSHSPQNNLFRLVFIRKFRGYAYGAVTVSLGVQILQFRSKFESHRMIFWAGEKPMHSPAANRLGPNRIASSLGPMVGRAIFDGSLKSGPCCFRSPSPPVSLPPPQFHFFRRKIIFSWSFHKKIPRLQLPRGERIARVGCSTVFE